MFDKVSRERSLVCCLLQTVSAVQGWVLATCGCFRSSSSSLFACMYCLHCLQLLQQLQQMMRKDTRMEMTLRAICHPSQPSPMQRYKKKPFASTVESRNGRMKRLKIWIIVSSISFLCSHLEDVEWMNCLCSPTSHIYGAHTYGK